MTARRPVRPETLAAKGAADPATGGVVAPIQASTTYERNPDGSPMAGAVYSRPDNPTYLPAEQLLAALEGGEQALLFSSGSAAAVSVFQSFAPGDHVVVPEVFYWGLRNWLHEFAVPWGLDVGAVDPTDLGAVAAALRPGRTRLVWLEVPANPTWDLPDVAAVAALAHEAGAQLAVDSTAATPVLCRPLSHGADLVVHSATKFLNGHSDVVAGAVVAARTDDLVARISRWRAGAGSVPGPFEAWLLARGMRTLHLRVRHASRTALELARRLEQHPGVVEVAYPGLTSHRRHELAARLFTGGFGAMLSFRPRGGEVAARAVVAAVAVITRATSLGGTETLIEHRAPVEGPGSPVAADLLRLSVGLEHVEDLWADLDAALSST